MKRILLLLLAFTAAAITPLAAQNYIVIDSEKVFKSIDAYNRALSTLDELAKSYQTQIDAKFEEVANLYDSYKRQENSLSASARQNRQNQILILEQEATEYQEKIFGQEGTMIKKRIELIQPIQKEVFDAIARYATQNGYEMVLDSASNPTLLYKSEKTDHTQALIDFMKKTK